ncbi:MAG: TonB-dependent receptor [Bacteroidales bacterium]|nr:TonB-dependent receptor [Bacteroidales bacterium]
MKAFSLLSFFLFSYLLVSSQTTLSGKVTDEENNPLPMANIVLENTFIGTFSNTKGEFTIKNIKTGTYTLKVSFIGYETHSQQIEVRENMQPIFISLKRSPLIADEIIVQATRNNDISSGNIKNISKETIQQKQTIQDIPYLLSYTPSVVSTSDAGTGIGYTGISIRGSDVRRINVTINDIPLNDAESHGVWWVDLPDIISSTDHIQIQRGVGSSTNGAGAFGATINLQTKSLNKDPFAELFGGYGSFNTSKFMVNTGSGLINNRFSVDVRLSKIYTDGFIDRAFSDLKSYYFSAGYYSEKSMVKFINFSGYEKTYQAWAGVPKDSFATRPTFNPYTYRNQTDNYWQSHYQLHYTQELSDHTHLHTALHYTYGKGYYESFRENKAYSEYNLPNVIFNNDTITHTNFIDQKWLDNDFYGFIASINHKMKKINATIGTGINRYEGRHFGDVIWAQFLPYSLPSYRWYFGTGDKFDANVFSKINFHAAEKLILTADLQYRTINYYIKGKDEYRYLNQHHVYHFFNPKAMIQYIVNNNQNINFSIATAHREPARSDFTDADSAKIPKPERLIDYELSYQLKSERSMLNINLYYMDYFNQLVMTGEINNVGTPINTNVKRSFRRGIEMEVGINVTKNIQWINNATLSENKIQSFTAYFDDWDNGGQISKEYKNTDISFSPNFIANSILQYSFKKNLVIQAMYKYVGSQYLSNIQESAVKIPSYNNVHLLINYYLHPAWCKEIQLQLSAKNLLTDVFISHGWAYSYFYNGKLEHMIGYYPQANNIIMASAIIKF